jgi:hypothetical protein
MEKSLAIGKYWLLYFQPNPETGERISIGLALQENGHKRIEYDHTFSKVQKLYPNTDVDSLDFYLNSVARDFDSGDDAESVLSSYGPQLGTSQARRVATPITDQTVKLLMNRCILPEKLIVHAMNAAAEERIDLVSREIEAFVKSASKRSLEMRIGFKVPDTRGRPIQGTKSVALAVPKMGGGWTLFDGVDLNKCSPSQSITRAEKVAHTFWSYSRAKDLLPPITCVGIVLNGTSHLDDKNREAHDWALHRFTTDSDVAIDAASTEAQEKIQRVLEGQDQRVL